MLSQTLADLTGLLSAELRGDPACLIKGVAPLSHAKPGQISFLDNPRHHKYLLTTKASAVILTAEFADKCQVNALIVPNPHYAYAKVAALFTDIPQPQPGYIHPSAVIDPGSQIADTASIAAQCHVGANSTIEEGVILESGCVIGENCHIAAGSRLWPNVVLYYGVTVGERCNIHAGTVIGSDGFGFTKHNGAWVKVPQLGKVIIGNDVDIGASTMIDRGAINDTIIGNGVKLDNLIQIAHNVVIGDHTAIAGCTGISGSVTIGKHCMIGGGVCIADNITIVDNVAITGASSVSRSIKKPGLYSSGISVQSNHGWRKNLARFHHLDAIARRVRALEKAMPIVKK